MELMELENRLASSHMGSNPILSVYQNSPGFGDVLVNKQGDSNRASVKRPRE